MNSYISNNLFRNLYIDQIEAMKSPEYAENIKSQIKIEQQKNTFLTRQAELLEKQIEVLSSEGSNLRITRFHDLKSNSATHSDLPKVIFDEHMNLMFQKDKIEQEIMKLGNLTDFS
jgi:hypothetical protein